MLSMNSIENVVIKMETLAKTIFSFFDFNLNASNPTFKNSGNVKINNIKNRFTFKYSNPYARYPVNR